MRKMVLLVEDDELHRSMVAGALEKNGYAVTLAENCAEALAALHDKVFVVALLDIRLPDGDGFELLAALQELQPECNAVMMTGESSIESAVRAMKDGAFDYLPKPFRTELLLLKLARIFAWHDLAEENRRLRHGGRHGMVGTSRALCKFLDSLKGAAESEATLLLLGETGSGKELAADFIHRHSFRSDGPFVKVNCGAIPESLLEVELFGCLKGAYTGADRSRPGVLEQAHGGTLFLDEIGEIPSSMQVKLLRALQEHQVTRVGAEKTSPADFRLVAATHRDLKDLRDSGQIRDDFFFRLNVISLNVPPLRVRRDDIPLLLAHFVELHSERHRKQPIRFAPEAIDLLQGYTFPGNVRELENLVQRLQVMMPGEEIQPRQLPEAIRQTSRNYSGQVQCFRTELPLREAVRDFELRFIQLVLAEENGNRTRTAERLGVSRKTLWDKLADAVTEE